MQPAQMPVKEILAKLVSFDTTSSKTNIPCAEWIRDYLAGRRTLLRVFVLVDARHGLKSVDDEILKLLDVAAVSYQAVLTKADKINPYALEKVVAETAAGLKKHAAAFPEVIATSAEKDDGIDILRATIAKLLVSQQA